MGFLLVLKTAYAVCAAKRCPRNLASTAIFALTQIYLLFRQNLSSSILRPGPQFVLMVVVMVFEAMCWVTRMESRQDVLDSTFVRTMVSACVSFVSEFIVAVVSTLAAGGYCCSISDICSFRALGEFG
jgi:hypothetical protein